MKLARATLLLASLAVPAIAPAQTDEQSPVVDPFQDQSPRGGVSARITDEREPTERESGFSFPKLSMPKLPKLSMPKWKLPKLQLPGTSRRESSTSRSRQTPRTTTPRTTTSSRSSTRAPSASGPSAWEKFNNGTKSFFTKTKDTLMPWMSETAQTPSRPPAGRTRVASNVNRSRGEDEKSSFFSPFLPGKEPDEEQVDSTTDFLSLPRPKFDD